MRHVKHHAAHKGDDYHSIIRELSLFHNCLLLEKEVVSGCRIEYPVENIEWDQEDVFWASRLYGYERGGESEDLIAMYLAEGAKGRPKAYKKAVPKETPLGTTVPSCRPLPIVVEEHVATKAASKPPNDSGV